MSDYGFLREKKVHVVFWQFVKASNMNLVYDLGTEMLKFLRVDVDAVEEFYNQSIKETLKSAVKSGADCFNKWFVTENNRMMEQCCYLHFYNEIIYQQFHVFYQSQGSLLVELYEDFPELEGEALEKTALEYSQRYEETGLYKGYADKKMIAALEKKSYSDFQPLLLPMLIIKDTLINRIRKLQEELRQDLTFMLADGEGDTDSRLSVSQRLCIYDLVNHRDDFENMRFLNRRISTRLGLYPGIEDEMVRSMNAVQLSEYMAENGIDLVEILDFNSMKDLLHFELIKAIENGVLIKRCENCGNYFIPAKRIDTVYCSEFYENTGKTCSEIGAVKKFQEKTQSNPVLEEFNKAYKRMNSRARTRKITHDEFLEWSKQAREMRDRCLDGEITIEQFRDWIGNRVNK